MIIELQILKMPKADVAKKNQLKLISLKIIRKFKLKIEC